MKLKIRPTNLKDWKWIRDLIIKEWGSEMVVSKGKIYNIKNLPGLAAEQNGEIVGHLTYHMENNECEIVTLNSIKTNQGIATNLLEEIKKIAVIKKCKRLWLITTNDNIKVLGFYQRKGFCLKAIYPNAIELSRKLKPEIPMIGNEGIPIRDEIELEIVL